MNKVEDLFSIAIGNCTASRLDFGCLEILHLDG